MDWSRNLYRGPDHDVTNQLDVAPHQRLYLAAFDGVAEAKAEAQRRALEATRPDITWMPVVGLDRSCSTLGVKRLDTTLAPEPLPRSRATGIRETIYQPITARRRAG